MESASFSVISVPSAWREASPALADASGLLDALERAAAAGGAGLEARWPCIGRYRACGKLGQGGMSTVWEALDEQLGRRVAIKLVRRDLSAEHGLRLRREAQALARLSHPNVVQVYEALEVDGLTAVVMELVEGQTLRHWQEQQPPPGWRACVELYLQAGQGLRAVHAAGLVHRDFKPDNCIVDAEGRVRVLDFGLVAREHEEPTVDERALLSASDSLEVRLTRTGTLMGTAAYMPPERLGRRGGDGIAGDQWSLCTSLYEALYGERPFAGGTELELYAEIERGRVRPPPRGSRVPSRVRAIVLRGLALRPTQRWAGMAELLAALERAVQPRRRWRWAGLGAAMVLAGAVGSAMVLASIDRRACPEPDLQGVWDDERRHAVREALLVAGTHHATETWARVEPMLDAHARHWAQAHREACEATRVTGLQTEQDMELRMRCLSGRKAALREVVTVLAHDGESTRRNAVELVVGLPALAGCDDLLALHAALPPTEDEELARAVELARVWLARVRAQREAGDYASAELLLAEAVEQAERLGYEPLLAEAWLERGELGLELARWDPVERDFERAYDLAQRSEHREVETRAASLLARLVAHEPSRLPAAQRWGHSAMNLAERRGLDRRLLAEATQAMGHVKLMQLLASFGTERGGVSWEGALALHHRALELYEDAMGPGHPAVATMLEDLGTVRIRQRKLEQGLDLYERALPLYEASLGPSHPSVAALLVELGTVLVKQEDPELALALFERALRIQLEVLGPEHPSVALTWTNIGIVRHMQGRFEDALALQQHALSLLERHPDRDQEAVIGVLSEIGFVLRDLGRMEEGLRYYERTVEIREQRYGPSHESILWVLTSIGDELLERGMVDEAEERYRRVQERCEGEGELPGLRCGIASLRLAELAVLRQDFDAAARWVEDASTRAGFSSSTGMDTLQAHARVMLARSMAEARHEGRPDLAKIQQDLGEAEAWMRTALTRGWYRGDPRRPVQRRDEG